MAKIISKASLTLGTNVKLHVIDFQGTDIEVDQTGLQIISTTTDFTASSETSGIVKRPIVVGDVITLAHTGDAANEGVELTVDTVAANLIEYTVLSGTPADEAAGAAINITGFKKTYQFLEAGALSFVDGVQGLVFGSWIVDEWDTGDLDIYPPVFKSIEPRAKSLASINGWEPHDTSTLHAIRDTALEVRPDSTSSATKIYALLRTTADLHETTDQMTFWPSDDLWDTAPGDFVMTGYGNQLVLILDTANTIDKRASNGVTWFSRCMEAGKTPVMQEHSLEYAEIYPLSANNAIDPKLADPGTGIPYNSDATIGGAGYSSILFNSDVDGLYSGLVDGNPYDFNGYVEGNSQSNEEVHEKVHYLLRQTTDINSDGTGAEMRGDKQWPKTSFSGNVFTVESYLENYAASQRNDLRLVDTNDIVRQWPSIFTLSIDGPALAVGGTFSLIHANTFGASGVTYLQDESANEQQDEAITSSTDIIIAYSSYNVDGHTANTPINLVLTWNRPGFIEPDNVPFTMNAENKTVAITPASDPSYTAA